MLRQGEQIETAGDRAIRATRAAFEGDDATICADSMPSKSIQQDSPVAVSIRSLRARTAVLSARLYEIKILAML